jgi:hypothetical protein
VSEARCWDCKKVVDVQTVYRCASCGWYGCEACFRVHLKEQIAPCHLTRLRELAELETQLAAARASTWQQAVGVAAQHKCSFDDETWTVSCSCGWRSVQCNEREYAGRFADHIRALQPLAAPGQD